LTIRVKRPYNVRMGTSKKSIVAFLKSVLAKRGNNASRMAMDLKVSHATIHRWLTGKDIPSTASCRKIASWSGFSLAEVLSKAGHIDTIPGTGQVQYPDFREYAHNKYPNELDEDIITLIEMLIERRRKPVNKSNK